MPNEGPVCSNARLGFAYKPVMPEATYLNAVATESLDVSWLHRRPRHPHSEAFARSRAGQVGAGTQSDRVLAVWRMLWVGVHPTPTRKRCPSVSAHRPLLQKALHPPALHLPTWTGVQQPEHIPLLTCKLPESRGSLSFSSGSTLTQVRAELLAPQGLAGGCANPPT